MTNEQTHKVHLSPEDQERLRELRTQKPARNLPKLALTPGAMLADRVAETVGSWCFIIIQSVLLGIWIMIVVDQVVSHGSIVVIAGCWAIGSSVQIAAGTIARNSVVEAGRE